MAVNPKNQKDTMNVNPENEAIIRKIFEIIGEDPYREGLKETPARVIKSWNKIYGGYFEDPKEVLGKVFEEDIKTDQGMVILKDIPFYSTFNNFYSSCETFLINNINRIRSLYYGRKEKVLFGLSDN